MDDDDDPWGEEPDWAIDDDDDGGNDEDGGGKRKGGGWVETDDRTTFGAQHVLALIDCDPSMFVPCVAVSSSSHEDDDDEDLVDDDEEEVEGTTTRGRQSLRVVTPFDAALTACERLLRLKVNYVATSKSGKRDGVGIVLYGTRGGGGRGGRRRGTTTTPPTTGSSEVQSAGGDTDSEEEDDDDAAGTETGSGSGSTHELIPLAPPGTEQILKLHECLPRGLIDGMTMAVGEEGGGGIGGEDDYGRRRDLEAEFASTGGSDDDDGGGGRASEVARRMGHASLCTLRSALHEASKAFWNAKCVHKSAATTKKPADAKSVWIFTNRPDPTNGNDEEKRHLITAAKDAVDNGLEIHVWPLPRAAASAAADDPEGECATTDDDRRPGSRRGARGAVAAASTFDRTMIFDSITTRDPSSDRTFAIGKESGCGVMGAFDLEDMMEDVNRQWKKVRRGLGLQLLLPGWDDDDDDDGEEGGERAGGSSEEDRRWRRPGIMVDLFRTVQVQRKPTAVSVHQETNKATVKTTQTLALDSGEIVPKERIRTYAEFGGVRVPISRTEVASIKRTSHGDKPHACLVVIGFRPITEGDDSTMPSLSRSLDVPYFVYPNDDVVKGSRKAFASLHASMLRKNVWAVAELLGRVTGTSRLVALVPQKEVREVFAAGGDEEGSQSQRGEEEEDGDGEEVVRLSRQVTPPGFLLLHLPYEDDVRAIEPDEAEASADADGGGDDDERRAVEAAIELVKHQPLEGLVFGVSFPNPALSLFWNYVESVALGTTLREIDPDDDETKMDEKAILEAASAQIEALKLCLPEDDNEGMKTAKGRKRKFPVVEDDSGIDWVRSYETDALSDRTVGELRKYLRAAGERVGGRKAELVDRVRESVEEGIRGGTLKLSSSSSGKDGGGAGDDNFGVVVKEECEEL